LAGAAGFEPPYGGIKTRRRTIGCGTRFDRAFLPVRGRLDLINDLKVMKPADSQAAHPEEKAAAQHRFEVSRSPAFKPQKEWTNA
jgi:hypothetical protein